MRWPFANWLRGAPGRDDPLPGASEAAPSAADPDAGAGSGSSARPAAWRDLPPLQRAVGSAPLTAPSAVFARDLASRRTPDPMLAPLGHDVSADGPAGLVSGIAVPLVQRALSEPERPPAAPLPAPAAPGRGRPTAQRSVTSVAAWPPKHAPDGAAGGSPLQGTPAEGSAVGVVVGPAAAESAASELAATEHAADIPGLAPRTLPVARLATATPAISATRVADATAPVPVLALARAVASGTSMPPSATSVPPSAAPSVDVTGPASGSVPDSVTAAPPVLAEGNDAARPVVARRTLGESRRLGLGAPLTGRPPSAARETGGPDLPVARLARETDVPGSTPAHPLSAPRVPAAAAASAPLPRLVVARRSTPATASVALVSQVSPAPPGAADPGSAGAPDDTSEDGAGEFAAGGASGSTRPLVGDTPIGVSRLAREDAATDADAEGAGEGAAEFGVTALRLAGTSGAGPVATSTAAMGPTAGPSAGPGPGATSAAPGSSPVAGESLLADEPAGSPALAAVQRSHAAPAGREPSREAGALPATRSAPALAPLVAGRVMRASLPAAMATLGYGPTAAPAPVVARLAIPSLGTGSDVSPAADRDKRPAADRDKRPFVARSAVAAGRGPSPATISDLPLARSAAGTAEPDAAETGSPGGVVGRAAGEGFTSAREGFTSAAPPPGPFVQRAVTIEEMTATPDSNAAGPAESGATAGPAGQPGATGGGAGTDYEELAEHVYDRIRSRFATELLLDRERAGMLVDG